MSAAASWKVTRKLYIDIETYCDVDLRKTTVYPYSEHPSFEILMLAYAYDDGPVEVLYSHEEILRVLGPDLQSPEVLKVAHNAQFERVCLTRLFPEKHDQFGYQVFLDAEQWDDTMARAGVWGHPQSLGNLARAMGTADKDEAGTRLINLFSKPYRGKRMGPDDRPLEWLDFVSYCVQDVETLREIDLALRDWPTQTERRVWLRDQKINDWGMKIDTELAVLARDAASENNSGQRAEIEALLGIENGNSVAQLLPALAAHGLQLPDLRADTVQEALDTADLSDVTRRALELRQDLALAASKKYQAALDCVSSDGRIRGCFRYFGAHTGRWTGRGVQPQNLPRHQLETEDDTDAAILDLKLGMGADSQTLKALVRALFVGPFVTVDYSAIEARVVAWLAGEQWALDAFAAGRDIYVETALRMGLFPHGVDPYTLDRHDPVFKSGRGKGKVAVLALGYNGAIGSLQALGADDTEEELLFLVRQWRSANQNIVSFWGEMEDAFWAGGKAGDHITVERDGSSRYVYLPSGRPIAYHGVKRRLVTKKGREPRDTITFLDPARRFPFVDTYGGRLTENVTQAVARDLLACALINLVDNGAHVVGHVHDEVIVHGDSELFLKTVNTLMCAKPAWARGLPVSGEGEVTRRYRK